MKIPSRLILLVIVMTTAACSITNTVRKHPQFKEVSANIHNIYILPPDIVITEKALSETDSRATAKEQIMQQTLRAEIPRYIRLQGRSISNKNFDEIFGVTADLTLQQLHSAFRKASNELHQNVKINKTAKGFTGNEKSKPKVSLGSVAKYVAKELDVDGLLMISYVGFEVSTNSVFLEQLDPRMSQEIIEPVVKAATSGGVFDIGLIDAGTGEVVWLNSNIQIAKPGQAPQNWTVVTRNLMSKLILTEPSLQSPPVIADVDNRPEPQATDTIDPDTPAEMAVETPVVGVEKPLDVNLQSTIEPDSDTSSKQLPDSKQRANPNPNPNPNQTLKPKQTPDSETGELDAEPEINSAIGIEPLGENDNVSTNTSTIETTLTNVTANSESIDVSAGDITITDSVTVNNINTATVNPVTQVEIITETTTESNDKIKDAKDFTIPKP